jgi:hypothetical protein
MKRGKQKIKVGYAGKNPDLPGKRKRMKRLRRRNKRNKSKKKVAQKAWSVEFI